MADLIISQPMTFTVDVRNGLVERPQRESLMRGDKMANRIIAELMYGSEPFDITGVTVKGKFCRPPSGDEIDLAGEAKGNVAEVQLTDQCYTSGGHYEASVILVLGGVERTVLFISGDVLKSGSGNAAGDEETGGSGGSTGSGLPAGGTAGQVLVKVSSAQGDAIWKTLTAADVGARPDNWMPTAADVGALGKNETAANANQLNGKDASEYLLAADALNMDLLWENATPESNLSSGAQVWFDNGYEFVVIIFSQEVGSKNRTTALARLQADTQMHINAFVGIAVEGVPTVFNRLVFLASNGMVFGGGNVKGLSATGYPTSDDSKMIPLLIYGIKGVGA